MALPHINLASLREQVIGVDAPIETPFGHRPMVYCDFTASGRSLRFVERYLQGLLQTYANTHTEDDVTGRSMSRLLHEAEAKIKAAVNAGPGGCIVACGTGATGAIEKLQQILGVALPPATRETIERIEADVLGAEAAAVARRARCERAPVVFIGPYEHHSNEVSWRQGLATVVTANLAPDGGVDLAHLESLLTDPRFHGRPRIGAFSAASNVTGMRTAVHEVAALLHRHGAFACFDYAASGPYVAIDMNPGGAWSERSLDAIFLSPHKFLGGPGASGVLVFNERLYRGDLPPTMAGGGTVDYVSPVDQDFITDVEEREKAGTPGILQTLRAALAFELKAAIGAERIEHLEQALLARAFRRWSQVEGIEILGNPDPARRIGIVSFNLRDPRGGWLHPKLVTALLNDLFGIQSRAGCSCAGPYGHRLLGIDQATSEQYRALVREGFHGIKPGWCRVGFHYVMDEAEADYVIEAVAFLARHGHCFLPLYDFDPLTGQWRHREFTEKADSLSLAAALGAAELPATARPAAERAEHYRGHLAEAARLAAALGSPGPAPRRVLDGRFGALQFFSA